MHEKAGSDNEQQLVELNDCEQEYLSPVASRDRSRRYRITIELQCQEIYAAEDAQGAEEIQRVVLNEPVMDQLKPAVRSILFRCGPTPPRLDDGFSRTSSARNTLSSEGWSVSDP